MVGWKCCRIEARVGKLGGVDTRYLIVRRRALDGALGLCAGGEVSRPGVVVLLAVPAMAGGKGLADDAMRAEAMASPRALMLMSMRCRGPATRQLPTHGWGKDASLGLSQDGIPLTVTVQLPNANVALE